MALNLLQIASRALDEISSVNSPSFIIGNTSDDVARTLLAAAYKVGEELARDYDWQELLAEATVTTSIGVPTYALPSDYEKIASDTMWDTTQSRRMYGAKTKRDWSWIANSSASSGISYRWRLKGSRIQVHPTPESAFSFTYDYLSNIYCTSSSGVGRENGWTDDTDLPKLPADLFISGIHYYFSKSKTLPGALAAGADYDAVIKSRQNKNKPAETIDYSCSVVAPTERERRVLNIPEVIPY